MAGRGTPYAHFMGWKEADMITGVITTKDILSHPATIVASFGILRYLYFLVKAVSPKVFFFTNLVMH